MKLAPESERYIQQYGHRIADAMEAAEAVLRRPNRRWNFDLAAKAMFPHLAPGEPIHPSKWPVAASFCSYGAVICAYLLDYRDLIVFYVNGGQRTAFVGWVPDGEDKHAQYVASRA